MLSYVDIPGVAEHEFLVPVADVANAPIPEGTRVWLQEQIFGWRPAEIRRPVPGNRYEVSLIGRGHRARPRQDEFKVRWSRPLDNPAKAIAIGLTEAPTFYEARSALLSELVRQRAACRGLTAAISAPIGLFHHQIDTAARVLADPVMRYLLADEVGLGKTIEAGIVIRQILIDDPDARVLVLCPETLAGQWRSELRDRLGLGDALQGTSLRVVPHSVLYPSRSRSSHWLASYDLIVIDEAHNLLPHLEPHSDVEKSLRRSRGLLALSATPMRGDLDTFRRLLALVDPVAFGDMEPADFVLQLQERERSARDVQVLSARRASLRQKAEVLDNIEADFPNDDTITDLVRVCRLTEDPHSSEWNELADYVREIYRLSRRMIRHRRSSEVIDSYSVAGRVPCFIEVVDPARPIIDDFLESYRIAQTEGISDVRFGLAVLHALAGPVAFLEFLKHPVLPSDRALFEMTSAQIEMAGTEHRLRVAASIIADRVDRGQLVVATSMFPTVITQFKPTVDELVGSDKTYRHLHSMSPEDRDESVSYFLSEYDGGVLLADSSIEEGRNLQEAEVLVNLDIPLDINQLEQRIGRLDRYVSRPTPAEVVVLTETASEWVSAHIELLKDGIGIFDESVSTVQRLLTTVLTELLGALLPKGSQAFDMDLANLRSDLEIERDNIDVLEELESVEAATVFTLDAFESLIEYESESDTLRSAVRRLTTGTGSLALKPKEADDGVVTFGGARGIGLSADEAHALAHLLAPKAFDRAAAMQQTGVMPFRIGDPLVNWLQEYMGIDERGRASAFARAVAGLDSPSLWLHCEFIVEFDAGKLPASEDSSRRQLTRRAEAHLQPMRMETWTDASGPAPQDLIAVLSRPFDLRKDEVLRGPVWANVTEDIPAWSQLCLDSAEAAWEEVRKSETLSVALREALGSAEEDTDRRLSILEARALRLATGSEWQAVQDELDVERQAADALLAGINNPAIRMMACGACVLWPEDRFG